MKTRANEAIRQLRRIIGRTQGEFAAMIGASKDAVASWETGRNRLSRQFARRIAFATGVEEGAAARGRPAEVIWSRKSRSYLSSAEPGW